MSDSCLYHPEPKIKRGVEVTLAIVIAQRHGIYGWAGYKPEKYAEFIWKKVHENIRPELGRDKDGQITTITRCIKLMVAEGLLRYDNVTKKLLYTKQGRDARGARLRARNEQQRAQGRKPTCCRRQKSRRRKLAAA